MPGTLVTKLLYAHKKTPLHQRSHNIVLVPAFLYKRKYGKLNMDLGPNNLMAQPGRTSADETLSSAITKVQLKTCNSKKCVGLPVSISLSLWLSSIFHCTQLSLSIVAPLPGWTIHQIQFDQQRSLPVSSSFSCAMHCVQSHQAK